MIGNFWINPTEYQVQTIAPLTMGLDLISDSRLADPRSLSDSNHIVFQNQDIYHRDRFTLFDADDSAFDSSIVRAIWQVNGVFWRIRWTNLDYYSGGAWNTKQVITAWANNTTFKSFYWRASSTSATWTASWTSSSRVLTTTGLTENAHIGRILKITSGSGSGQEFLITGNTTTAIYIDDTFEYIPVAWNTFEIYARVSSGYFSTGADVYEVFDDTSRSVLGFTYWDIEVHKERLYVAQQGKVLYSSIGVWEYIKPSNFIQIGSWQFTPVLRSFWDRLRIYTIEWVWDLYGEGPDNFNLVKRSDRGLRNTSSHIQEQPAENCVQDQFFISNDGVESSRYHDDSAYKPVPISANIFRNGSEIWAYAKLAQFNGRLYLFNNTQRAGAVTTDVWVYDTQSSAMNRNPTWSKFTLPRTVDAVYYYNNVLYLGIGGIIVKTATAGTPETTTLTLASPSITTQRLNQKDIERPKTYYKVRSRITLSWAWDLTIWVWYEWGAISTLRTIPYNYAQDTELDAVVFPSKTKKDITVKITATPTNAGSSGTFRPELLEIYYKPKSKKL